MGDAETSAPTPQGSIGLGFAIPVQHVMRIAAELIATGRASHGWLGAQVSSDMAARGARIVDVTAGSPAATAGLTPGALVTEVGDQRHRQRQRPNRRGAVKGTGHLGDSGVH